METNFEENLPPFLNGGGEMGALIRAIDWAAHPLGVPGQWPPALKIAAGIMLSSKFPMLICWGPDYIQLYNDSFRPINGRMKHPRALGGSARDTYAEIWETIGPLFADVMQGNAQGFSDFMVPLDRNGYPEDCYFDFSYSPIVNEDGSVGGILVVCKETTEDRFRTMAEGSDILIAVADETGNGVFFNKAWVALTGKSMEELLAFGWAELIHPDDKERWVNTYLAAFKDKASVKGEFRVKSKNGDYRWLLAMVPARFRNDGSFAGYISSCTDVTDQRRLLDTISDSEAKLDQVIDMLPASITVLIGEDFVIERTNPSNLAYWQKSGADVIGKPLLEALPELVDQAFPGQLKQVLDTGITIIEKEHPVKLQTPGGAVNTTYVDYSYQPLTDKDGRRVGVLVMSDDVTEKVESRWLLEKYAAELHGINEEMTASNEELSATNEELTAAQANLQQFVHELAVSEARFRFLVQGAPVAIGVLNGRDLVIESANDLILKLWGKPASIVGLRLADALPELKGQPFLRLLDDVYTSGKPFYGYEVKARLEHEGSLRDIYFDFIYQPVSDSNGLTSAIMVVAVDVSLQVNAKLEQLRAEEMLRFSIDAANAATWYLDMETGEYTVSERLRELFGLPPDSPVSQEIILNQVPEAYRDQLRQAIHTSLRENTRYFAEHPLTGRAGQQYWVRAVGKVYPAVGNSRANFSGLIIDITEQRADEQRKNDFIGMVSHELKTPLTSLSAIVQVTNAKLKHHPDPFLSNSMEKAAVQVKKMSTMINGFLNVTRLESGKMLVVKTAFPLEELIREVIAENELTVTTHIVELNLCDHVMVTADREKVGSVIANLISNAVKYSPKGKQVKVRCIIKENNVEVSVKDEGMGIAAEHLPHVFDRYFRVETTDTRHISGFGIGLYLSAEIIRQHDGSVWAESEPGAGSTFYFTLPL